MYSIIRFLYCTVSVVLFHIHKLKPYQTLHSRWVDVFLAPVLALLATILIFMDQQITAVIVNRKEHKLKKGCGYHLDLLVRIEHSTIKIDLSLIFPRGYLSGYNCVDTSQVLYLHIVHIYMNTKGTV